MLSDGQEGIIGHALHESRALLRARHAPGHQSPLVPCRRIVLIDSNGSVECLEHGNRIAMPRQRIGVGDE